MKRYILSLAILIVSALSWNAKGQVHVNVNIGVQPRWVPRYEPAEYYYLPDLDAYYYVPGSQFIYIDGGQWVFAASLPPRFRSYDLYRGYKVPVNEPYPYRHGDIYRERYGRDRGWNGRREAVYHRSYRDRDDDHWDDRGHGRGHYKHHHH